MRRICAIAAAALCALPVVFSGRASAAPVSVQRSGWFWGIPAPQGETLNDVAFQGPVGYAVGEHGTVLRSNDNGQSWSGLASGTEADLTLVQELEAGTVIVGGGCTLRESRDGGAGFVRLPVNESEQSCATKIASFSFLNASIGYVEQADGSILYTTDGGQSWTPRTSVPLSGGAAVQIEFISPTVGLALVNTGEGGRILRTADGSGSWTQVASVASHEPLSSLSLPQGKLAYAVGGSSAPVWLASEDEGQTWVPRAVALGAAARPIGLRRLSCASATQCLASTLSAPGGAASNLLLSTSDGGETATISDPSEASLGGVAFASGSNAVAVGAGGATVLSADGGLTFPAALYSSLSGEYSAQIRLGSSPGDAYLPGHAGRIAVTTDGGAAWSVLQVPTSEPLVDVSFPTSTVGYTVNAAGTVYRTADGGASWSILGSGGEAPSALVAPSATSVLAVGPTGLRRSTNSGAAFSPLTGSVVVGHHGRRALRRPLSGFPLFGGAQVAGSALIAWGNQAIESTDGGATWKLIGKPLAKGSVEAISFLSASTGYEVSRQRLFFTRNGGRSWSEISSLGTAAPGAAGTLSFSSVQDGYVLAPFAGRDDVLLRTSDGGRTWTPELLPRSLQDVQAGDGVDYAYGQGSLFGTTDGGLDTGASSLTLAVHGSASTTRAKLARQHGRVMLSGRLSPAEGAQQVVVSMRTAGRSVWEHRTVTVASGGSFSLTVGGISATTTFVAQWAGEAPESGAGSAAVTLRVTHR